MNCSKWLNAKKKLKLYQGGFEGFQVNEPNYLKINLFLIVISTDG